MSQAPSFLAHDSSKTMWTDSSCTESSARADAAEYKRKYHADAQFIFSRVQHHVHKKTKDGYVPLAKDCVSKSSKGLCKHGFPKVKQLNMKGRVVCSGNAKKFGLRISGKRNASGLPLNARSRVWQSGTNAGFALILRGNSHTAPNYRLPLVPQVHDDEWCQKGCVHSKRELMQRSKRAQLAQREATGYYCG